MTASGAGLWENWIRRQRFNSLRWARRFQELPPFVFNSDAAARMEGTVDVWRLRRIHPDRPHLP